MRESEIGRAILAEHRSLLDVLANRERLRALPEGSLGRVYLAFMEHEGLTADGLADAADEGYQQRSFDPDVRTFADWARDSHDLWHVLTGYGRDPLGELCLLGVLYSQIRTPGTAFIALLGLLQVPFEYPGAPSIRAVMQGFSIGRRAQWMIAQDWEALLALPIDEVREQLGLERPTYYEQSAPLHDASRSRSRAAAAQAVRSRPTRSERKFRAARRSRAKREPPGKGGERRPEGGRAKAGPCTGLAIVGSHARRQGAHQALRGSRRGRCAGVRGPCRRDPGPGRPERRG
jgi:ubiquinone biosynthesis protein COQ4